MSSRFYFSCRIRRLQELAFRFLLGRGQSFLIINLETVPS
jgi:hypothetical protein